MHWELLSFNLDGAPGAPMVFTFEAALRDSSPAGLILRGDGIRRAEGALRLNRAAALAAQLADAGSSAEPVQLLDELTALLEAHTRKSARTSLPVARTQAGLPVQARLR